MAIKEGEPILIYCMTVWYIVFLSSIGVFFSFLSLLFIFFFVLSLHSKQLEEEKSKLRQIEASSKDLSTNWLKERDDLKKQTTDLRSKTEELESTITAKDKKLKEMVLLSRTFYSPFSAFFTCSPPSLLHHKKTTRLIFFDGPGTKCQRRGQESR